MNILITGGAGYIGSHVLKALLEKNSDKITVIDNFYSGSRDALVALESVGKFEFIKCDLADTDLLEEIFSTHKFDAIIHFAAYIEVFESMQNPLKYYLNNTANTANLINLALKFGVKKFIFSSTAATYGEPENGVVCENSPQNPINPYGNSKLMSEQILKDAAAANSDFKFGILRYFNVAGASLDGLIGQNYPNATHLIKVATQTITGKRANMSIFGRDYDTKDGTCIRDYIHIEDLADAHLAVLDYLDDNDSDIFNVGYGHGFSVLEVINMAKKISGVGFEVMDAPRRLGDPAILIADSSKLRDLTSWKPKKDSLETIISSALAWEKKIF
ncbi:MAG: UDP-glucose 4-epimerase GalE [Campylobacter lanienae]|uniref:UDP-glucose 4-epimerase GalE n=1 Tax=Campylobacter lanienae TaxID=75658 RepID=UPI00242E18C2|nr:UDP-glucose 4-epimerase GalE [Campylobacter lanienae]MDD7514499.1 UDP-glucose 4-epimerase GalE [Campylobacter lanienae]